MRSEKKSSSHSSLPGSRVRCLAGLLLCVSLLAGCATPNNVARDPDQVRTAVDALYKNADDELANGDREKAVALLTQAGKEDPENTEPWLKIANIWFDSGDYPASILAANEVLRRDAVNQKAKSILVVAGLRVAASAVNGLKEGGAIATSERVQAQNLTNSLREILGEKVLVPPPAAVAQEKAASRPTRKFSRAHHVSATTASPKAPVATSGAASDPFKSLK